MILEQYNTITSYDLGDGLRLRFATVDDIEELAQFNGRIHGSSFVAQWTREFAAPSHPTCGPDNVTVVEETTTRKIVSSICLIPQVWTYDGLPFPVGRPEAVGTDPAYRRRGLIRAQFDVLHAKSDREGHLAQGITGIPWYYRQFGYEYAIDLDAGRNVYPALIPVLKAEETEAYRLRPITLDDLPFVIPLCDRQDARSLIACPSSEAEWRRDLLHSLSPESAYHVINIIETLNGRPVGYVTFARELWGDQFRIVELNICEDESLRSVVLFVLRALNPIAEETARQQGKSSVVLSFRLGVQHPVFDAAPDLFHKTLTPYGWYMRVAHVPRFLNHIAPVLERRLAQSALSGYAGEIKVSEYVRGFKLIVERGKIRSEARQPPSNWNDGVQAWFPPLTFLQIVFGRRSFDELDDAYPDCFAEDEVAPMLRVLFPKKPSNVLALA